MDGSFIEDIAERGNAIVATATAIFTGLIDGATKFAQDNGGGGNGPGSGWRRKEDVHHGPHDDETSWTKIETLIQA